MKATILVDNNAACDLKAEWGLAIYIEYESRRILLDTGASGLFAENARKLGINLNSIDFGVLSHAHYDHGNGLDTFFKLNDKAPFYISAKAGENCYSLETDRNSADYGKFSYDGIKKGVLKQYEKRIRVADETCHQICKGVYLLSHTTPGLSEIGRRVGQYVAVEGSCNVAENSTAAVKDASTAGYARCNGTQSRTASHRRYIPDDFSHEQSLVLRTDVGLVIFNSCCHAGVENIIREVREAFPGETVCSIIGGFHMYPYNETEVLEQAEKIRACGIRHIVTGHCTGEKQYVWLKNALENGRNIQVEQLHCGLQFSI